LTPPISEESAAIVAPLSPAIRPLLRGQGGFFLIGGIGRNGALLSPALCPLGRCLALGSWLLAAAAGFFATGFFTSGFCTVGFFDACFIAAAAAARRGGRCVSNPAPRTVGSCPPPFARLAAALPLAAGLAAAAGFFATGFFDAGFLAAAAAARRG
jgi:hypothetical protein